MGGEAVRDSVAKPPRDRRCPLAGMCRKQSPCLARSQVRAGITCGSGVRTREGKTPGRWPRRGARQGPVPNQISARPTSERPDHQPRDGGDDHEAPDALWLPRTPQDRLSPDGLEGWTNLAASSSRSAKRRRGALGDRAGTTPRITPQDHEQTRCTAGRNFITAASHADIVRPSFKTKTRIGTTSGIPSTSLLALPIAGWASPTSVS